MGVWLFHRLPNYIPFSGVVSVVSAQTKEHKTGTGKCVMWLHLYAAWEKSIPHFVY